MKGTEHIHRKEILVQDIEEPFTTLPKLHKAGGLERAAKEQLSLNGLFAQLTALRFQTTVPSPGRHLPNRFTGIAPRMCVGCPC